jgi:DNA-binding transcriptional LysR family regulator
MRELHGAPVLLLDDGHCFREQALSWCTRAHLEELDYRATSLPTLAQMVADGAGITLLPALAIPTGDPAALAPRSPVRRPGSRPDDRARLAPEHAPGAGATRGRGDDHRGVRAAAPQHAPPVAA